METTGENIERSMVRREAAHHVNTILSMSPISVIALVDALIGHAYVAGASDIHIAPGRTDIRIRFRIDGQLEETHRLPFSIRTETIARLKILSNIRIDEHHVAHDGRFRFSIDSERSIDVRVSIAPTFYGENAVLRLLSLEAHASTLEHLGFSSVHARILSDTISQPNGMILATGPTGSGKTTTLYALIAQLAEANLAISTIEDPIEYSIDAASQMAVNPRSGLTFAQGLRSIVRQDPDVIMVGEIRDSETAHLASTAALTGHLIFSTLHTGDAPTALIRLKDLGVPAYLIASSVTLVIAQRLMRRICSACAEPIEPDAQQAHTLSALMTASDSPSGGFMRGIGCSACHGSGYRGRIGAYELLRMDDLFRSAILQEASDIRAFVRIAQAQGMEPLIADALRKAALGIVTLDEVMHFRSS